MRTLAAYFSGRQVAQATLASGGSVPLRFTHSIEEHLVTRRSAGVFDFSFMGWWVFRGSDALRCLQRLQTRDLQVLRSGRVCYTLLCREDGSVWNDATVWRHDAQTFWLFTGRRSDGESLQACAHGFDVEIRPLSDLYAIVAIQGPASSQLLENVLPRSTEALPYFAFRACEIDGVEAWIGRLGYSGELGYELLMPASHAATVWRRLVDTPSDVERLECGMEAANSLRIEAGYIHFAFELANRAFPGELGLSRLVRTGGGAFVGQAALRGTDVARRRLAGIKFAPASLGPIAYRAPRHDHVAVQLTSEAYSPTFAREIGLAFVAQAADLGGIVYTEDGRRAELARLPFRDPTRALVRQRPR